MQNKNENNTEKEILIVGAGPAGLIKAIEAYSAGYSSISLIEKRSNYTRDIWFDFSPRPWFVIFFI